MNSKPTKASDIYSLGVTYVRLLTGIFPPSSDSSIYDDYNDRWLWREYLQQQGIKVSSPLAAILDKMIAKWRQKIGTFGIWVENVFVLYNLRFIRV